MRITNLVLVMFLTLFSTLASNEASAGRRGGFKSSGFRSSGFKTKASKSYTFKAPRSSTYRSLGSSRVYYGGGKHSSSLGGTYLGSSGSSHKGGRYMNANTGNRYGRHK